MPSAADLQTGAPASVQSTFAWRARDSEGLVCSGTMTAGSAREVAASLRDDGRFVVSIRQSASGTADEAPTERGQARMNRDESIAFFRQLSVMLEAGVPISEALEAILRQSTEHGARTLIGRIQREVEAGESLSTALARRPRSFSPVVVSLIRAAEATGSLDVMARRAGEHLAKERRVVQQVRTALTYPGFMAGAGGVIILSLLAFVLPRFASIYESRSATLPLPTRVLMSSATFLREQWWWYLPLLGLAVIIVLAWSRSESARRQLDLVLLRLPVVRSVLVGAMVSRWTRTLSVLCSAGVNLVDAVSIVRGATRSHSQRELWDDVERSIRDGRPLAASLEESTLVPASVSAMISAGERSGRLPEVLVTIADCTEEDLESTVKRTTSLIEPAMIVALGLVVGMIALAMLLPVFGMSSMVSG